ncbi:MAG: NUDIX hydrolase [Candidatus Binatus sp.]|uniref:NUDIX hydrolase n=1 Tax=Candidatus Binatus sp. TaxID=2811406 RepID=UPI0027242F2B|nr:NUDIX hydrolase [Candidatus Binatus sp.]MDO8431308.1 NUDIX hydrolase [Candidatus Binatus sp.]
MSKAPVHPNHRLQRDYPAKVRFCPLCGGSMAPRLILPDNVTRKVCDACGFVHFPGPKLVAGCLVIDHGKVLLLRRGIEPARGKWTFPGGYVDLGENAADAALRETREEVGMRVELGSVLGVLGDTANPSLTLVVYLARPLDYPAMTSEEATEVQFFAPDEIPWSELAFPTTVDALTAWIANARKRD